MTSVCRRRASSPGRASCMPRTIASRPSDSGRPYFSSIRSVSWTISATSASTGSPSEYSLRNVSKEQSSPRWERRAPATSNSSAPSGASEGSPKKANSAAPSWSTKRRISQAQAVRSTWHPRRVAHSTSRPPGIAQVPAVGRRRRPLLCPGGLAPDGPPGRPERLGGLLPQRRAEVVAPAFGPEPALEPAKPLHRGLPTAPKLRLAPEALGLGDDLPVGLLPGGAERPHEPPLLRRGPGAGLPPGLPDPVLQPLELLARHGVLGQRRHPVLQVERPQGLQPAPHGHPVARRVPWQPVGEQHPARPVLHGPEGYL